MADGKLFVISAPSGAGKSTLIARIRALFPLMLYSISCTTRSPRRGETDGIEYYFLSKEKFAEMVRQNQFLEWKRVHDHEYGTPAQPVLTALKSGRCMILDIDTQGAKEVFQTLPASVGIFVKPPTMGVLEQRIRQRGTESEESIHLRLMNAEGEMQMASLFQYHIINGILGHAVTELADVIRKESDLCGS
jgi:guanylate kinase